MAIAWLGGTLPPELPSVPILTVKDGPRKLFRFLGDVEWLDAHYLGETVPCLGGTCLHCERRIKKFQHGYAPTEHYSQLKSGGDWAWIPTVLSIPKGLHDELLPPMKGKLRWVKRHTTEKNSSYQLESKIGPDATVNPWFDVKPVLERHWSSGRSIVTPATSSEPNADAPSILKFPGLPARRSAERKEGVA